MAAMTKRQELSVSVDYYAICLQDWDDAWLPAPFPEGFDHSVFLQAHPGRLDIASAGHTHHAHFTVEVWDAPPPEPAGEWEGPWDSAGSLCLRQAQSPGHDRRGD